MKRFVIGFVIGVGLVYWYLHHGDAFRSDVENWFHGSASRYRDDKQHKAAREALGEGGQHR
jgi:hypothetical protein